MLSYHIDLSTHVKGACRCIESLAESMCDRDLPSLCPHLRSRLCPPRATSRTPWRASATCTSSCSTTGPTPSSRSAIGRRMCHRWLGGACASPATPSQVDDSMQPCRYLNIYLYIVYKPLTVLCVSLASAGLYSAADLLMTDGKALSLISSAVQAGPSHLLMGAWGSRGLLICRMPDASSAAAPPREGRGGAEL